MWAALQTEIENFFLLGNNKEWARSQLLRLRQGPHQRIDDFLAQFQVSVQMSMQRTSLREQYLEGSWNKCICRGMQERRGSR